MTGIILIVASFALILLILYSCAVAASIADDASESMDKWDDYK